MKTFPMFDGFSTRSVEWYDAIHSGKPYEAEAEWVYRKINSISKQSQVSMIEYGCGTGRYTSLFVDRGLRITAVDPSQSMLNECFRACRRSDPSAGTIREVVGSLTDLKELGAHTCGVALFNVLGYAAAGGNLGLCLHTFRKNLATGGIVAFDYINLACAVAALRPYECRQILMPVTDPHECEVGPYPQGARGRVLTREVHKRFDPHDNSLVYIIRYAERGAEEWYERHVVQVFSPREIEHALHAAGFYDITTVPAYTDSARVTEHDFYCFTMARAG